MKIWRLYDPADYTYATGGATGGWIDDRLCDACGAPQRRRVQPLQLYWEPGSDRVGDFVWPLLAGVAITERAFGVLRPFTGFDAGPVEFVENPQKGLPKRPPRVGLPYKGPALSELWITATVGFDREASSAELERACPVCGTERWQLSGVARMEVRWDQVSLTGSRVLVPRVPGKGLMIRAADLADDDIFHVRPFLGIYCTDRVRQAVLQAGLTNVDFLEMGDII